MNKQADDWLLKQTDIDLNGDQIVLYCKYINDRSIEHLSEKKFLKLLNSISKEKTKQRHLTNWILKNYEITTEENLMNIIKLYVLYLSYIDVYELPYDLFLKYLNEQVGINIKENIIYNLKFKEISAPIVEQEKSDEGYIYIIQDCRFIETNKPIYKIGKTNKPLLARINNYSKGSQLCYYIKTLNCAKVEKKVIDIFKKKFFQKKHDIGTEYFEGDIKLMIKEINQIYDIYNLNISNIEELTIEETKSEELKEIIMIREWINTNFIIIDKKDKRYLSTKISSIELYSLFIKIKDNEIIPNTQFNFLIEKLIEKKIENSSINYYGLINKHDPALKWLEKYYTIITKDHICYDKTKIQFKKLYEKCKLTQTEKITDKALKITLKKLESQNIGIINEINKVSYYYGLLEI